MSWTTALYETYEQNVGKDGDAKKRLVPVAHINAKAQIEISINTEGNFIGVNVVSKEDETTIIPVTEKSASRSSGIAPHPLCDTLSYISRNYSNYCDGDKEANKSREKYKIYIQELEKWMQSDTSNIKLSCIYKYLKDGNVIDDLIKSGIVSLNSKNCFDDKKINGNSYEKMLVRFRVVGEPEECTWKDTKLFESYIAYYQAQNKSESSICYISGKNSVYSENHPKGIVAASYGAKLISSNDSSGFTYRGRFSDSSQACTISYEASQKIHAALTYLAANQGVIVGSKDKRTYICWNPRGKETPNLFNMFDVPVDYEGSLNEEYQRKLKKIFKGYDESFASDDEILFIGLDAATTGRLSVTYYSEQNAYEFMKKVRYWAETVKWYFIGFAEKKSFWETRTPSFDNIIRFAYGIERSGRFEVDDKIYKDQIQRLVKCLVNRVPFPFDLVEKLKNKVTQTSLFKWENGKSSNWEKALAIACAIIVKYRIDHEIVKESEDVMVLDENNNNRSYLFGRLLAVLEKVEKRTYERGERRETNAIRLLSAYVNHPMQTWMTLEQLLNPYFQKLSPGPREYYKRIISEIVSKITSGGDALNKPLKEDYLLGYYLQRAELNKSKETDSEDEK